MSLGTIALIVLIIVLFGGGTYLGPGPGYYGGFGLGGFLLLILVILLITGRL